MATNTTNAIYIQTLIALGPLLMTISSGMTSGYSAILLPQITHNDSGAVDVNASFHVTESEGSWIASIAALPMALGCIIGGVLMEKIGRKATHLATSIPCIIGWALIGCAHNLTMLLLGRFLGGTCAGILGSATGVYISETSDPMHRSLLLAGISLAITKGLLFVHLLGTVLDWRSVAYIACALPSIGALILVTCAPESPAWLARNSEAEKARHAFVYCRGDGADAQTELNALFQSIPKTTNSLELQQRKTRNETLLKPKFLRSLCILIVFIVTNQWCGVNVVAFYTVTIMQRTLRNVNVYVAMLSVDVIRLLASLLACVLMRHMGRRPLALISGTGTFLSLSVLAGHNFWLCRLSGLNAWSNQMEARIDYVPMCALVAFVTFTSVGLVPLPWAMIGEVYPLAVRNIGSSVTSMMGFVAFFSVVKTGPTMFESIGIDGTFAVYGAVALTGTVFLAFFLPETRNVALHEIEAKTNQNQNGTTNSSSNNVQNYNPK